MIETSLTAVLIIIVCVLGTIGVPVEPFKEAMVLRMPNWFPVAFQINGFIFVPDWYRHHGVPHEYGHYLQQLDLGFDAYIATTAVPSILSSGMPYHKEMPWEVDANRRGRKK